jgi:hypothetical protein
MTDIDRVLGVKTDQRVHAMMQRAAGARMTADELLAQRVSFVFGSMDEKSNVTKERVREVILGLSGAQSK